MTRRKRVRLRKRLNKARRERRWYDVRTIEIRIGGVLLAPAWLPEWMP